MPLFQNSDSTELVPVLALNIFADFLFFLLGLTSCPFHPLHNGFLRIETLHASFKIQYYTLPLLARLIENFICRFDLQHEVTFGPNRAVLVGTKTMVLWTLDNTLFEEVNKN